MSREVRRVPVGWKHPLEYNPHWEFQASTPYGRSRPVSWLHGPEEKFVALVDDYPGAVARWEEDLRAMQAREGWDWTFALQYYITGYQGRDDAEPSVHPYHVWSDDGQREIPVELRDADHLHELELNKVLDQKPDPADYMPVFLEAEEELGWCLYQTVSEGTPVTPVFATAAELIEHLCIIGQDHNQEPMRRAAAEALVNSGGSVGSMMVVGNTLLRSDMDADLIEALPKADA